MFVEAGTDLPEINRRLKVFLFENDFECELGYADIVSTIPDAVRDFLSHDTFDFIFIEIPPESPGLVFCGGQLTHHRGESNSFKSYFTGTGLTVWSAVASSIGEAYEQISCFSSECNNFPTLDTKLSPGFGAGANQNQAIAHGILELVEHDALSHWWLGGDKAHRLSHNTKLDYLCCELHKKIRKDQSTRDVTILDLSSRYLIPTVAVVSFDTRGECFALGSAARTSYEEAVVSAYMEMCQMEYGHHIIRAKVKQHGWGQLSEAERLEVSKASVIRKESFLEYTSDEANPLYRKISSSIEDLSSHIKNFELNFQISAFDAFPGPYWVCKTSCSQLSSIYDSMSPYLKADLDSPFVRFKGLLP